MLAAATFGLNSWDNSLPDAQAQIECMRRRAAA
jgi:hypothetical protein